MSEKTKVHGALSTLQVAPDIYTTGTRDTTELLVSRLLTDDEPA